MPKATTCVYAKYQWYKKISVRILLNKKKKSIRSNGQLVNSFSTTAEKRKYMVDFDKNIK